MPDVLTSEQRTKCMSHIRGKDTQPELIVRSLIHKMGYRFRLHRSDLPGRPDLVFPQRRKAINVHGCFWHQHKDCRYASIPKSRTDFWLKKLEGNRERDARNDKALSTLGWSILIIWECQLRDIDSVAARIREFLNSE